MARFLITLLTLACFTACTTLQPLPDAQPATLQSLKAGDSVELELASGERRTLKVESVNDQALQGVDGGKRYSIPLSEIRGASVRAMTTSDKVWTGIGIAAALGAVIAIAGGDGLGGGRDGGPGY